MAVEYNCGWMMGKISPSRLPLSRHQYCSAAGACTTELMVQKRKRYRIRLLAEAQSRPGWSVGLRVSEVVGIRTSELDFERGLLKILDEK